MSEKIAVIIPARFASSRYPGKPLVLLKAADGTEKPLIQRTWECARKFAQNKSADIYVATDDGRIADCVTAFGGKVIMTSEHCVNGTERCAEALEKLPNDVELIINLQGDAPLTPAWFLSDMVDAMTQRQDMNVATPVLRCDRQAYDNFIADRKAGQVGGTLAVFANDHAALYFSKEVIPFMPETYNEASLPVFHHVGVYAYRREALKTYMAWPQGRLEQLEGLEQLRFLENGTGILCVEVDAKGRHFWELNNPQDVARIEEVL